MCLAFTNSLKELQLLFTMSFGCFIKVVVSWRFLLYSCSCSLVTLVSQYSSLQYHVFQVTATKETTQHLFHVMIYRLLRHTLQTLHCPWLFGSLWRRCASALSLSRSRRSSARSRRASRSTDVWDSWFDCGQKIQNSRWQKDCFWLCACNLFLNQRLHDNNNDNNNKNHKDNDNGNDRNQVDGQRGSIWCYNAFFLNLAHTWYYVFCYW